MIPDALLRLAINRIVPLRPHEKLQLEDLVDSEQFFRALTPEVLSGVLGRRVTTMETSPDDLLRGAERDLRFLSSRECAVLCVRDARYPAALREIFDPPYLLYVRGTLPRIDRPSVAVVGTREPTAAAVLAARELAAELAANGLTVVSGLARGIDAAAHEGALRTCGATSAGSTGAILASGVDLITPASHRALAAAILDAGGYLASEYAPGTPPRKYFFPARNRIIAGLARGAVVVQAPARSGALITADYALDQGRDLFVHRAGLLSPAGTGTAELAADGAIVVDRASDVLAEWGIEPVSYASVAATAPIASASGAGAARVLAMREALRGREATA